MAVKLILILTLFFFFLSSRAAVQDFLEQREEQQRIRVEVADRKVRDRDRKSEAEPLQRAGTSEGNL